MLGFAGAPETRWLALRSSICEAIYHALRLQMELLLCRRQVVWHPRT